MLARYMLLPVCLSVRPSVTQVDQSKTRHLFIVTTLASVLFKMMHFGDYKKTPTSCRLVHLFNEAHS